MSKPTEAEVEAAAKVMAGFCIGGIIDEPKLPWPCWMGSARAMLTAAAQAREMAEHIHPLTNEDYRPDGE